MTCLRQTASSLTSSYLFNPTVLTGQNKTPKKQTKKSPKTFYGSCLRHPLANVNENFTIQSLEFM